MYSALYGLVDPEVMIAPDDVSLKDAPPAERLRMGEVAASQLPPWAIMKPDTA